MRKITIEPATLKDADELSERMRPADRAEVMASHGHSPQEAARFSVLASSVAFCARVDGVAACLFGVQGGTAFDPSAGVWLLGSDEISRIRKEFWRESRKMVWMFLQNAPRLENFVHVNNKESIRWLKRLGARFDEPAPYGVAGEMFQHFVIEQGGV